LRFRVQIAAPEGFSTRFVTPAHTLPGSLMTLPSLLVSIVAFRYSIMPLFSLFINFISLISSTGPKTSADCLFI
jgi:hypothetical protein